MSAQGPATPAMVALRGGVMGDQLVTKACVNCLGPHSCDLKTHLTCSATASGSP